MLLYDGGNSGGFSSFKIIGDLFPISGFSSNSSWNITGIPFERNDLRSSSSPITENHNYPPSIFFFCAIILPNSIFPVIRRLCNTQAIIVANSNIAIIITAGNTNVKR